jgi:TRAP-type C4-dicarboxylate transport system permease small subunit
VLITTLFLMALIPVIELVGRALFSTGIAGATEYLQHLTLWIGFLGAMLAAREGKHLRIATSMNWFSRGTSHVLDGLQAFVSAAVCFGLFGASLQLVVAEAPGLPPWSAIIIPDFIERWLEPFGLFESGGFTMIGGWLPIWFAEAVMPFGFAIMGIRFILRASERLWVRALVGLSVPAMIFLPLLCSDIAPQLVLPGVMLLGIAAAVGTPIFIFHLVRRHGPFALLGRWCYGRGHTCRDVSYRSITDLSNDPALYAGRLHSI